MLVKFHRYSIIGCSVVVVVVGTVEVGMVGTVVVLIVVVVEVVSEVVGTLVCSGTVDMAFLVDVVAFVGFGDTGVVRA